VPDKAIPISSSRFKVVLIIIPNFFLIIIRDLIVIAQAAFRILEYEFQRCKPLSKNIRKNAEYPR